MIIRIDSVKIAEELSDAAITYETYSKIFIDKGYPPNRDDIRDSDEWVKHYEYYFKMVTNLMIEDEAT